MNQRIQWLNIKRIHRPNVFMKKTLQFKNIYKWFVIRCCKFFIYKYWMPRIKCINQTFASIECQRLNTSTKHGSILELFKSFCLLPFSLSWIRSFIVFDRRHCKIHDKYVHLWRSISLYHLIQKFNLLK